MYCNQVSKIFSKPYKFILVDSGAENTQLMTKEEYKRWQQRANPSKKLGSRGGGYDKDWQKVRAYILARDGWLCQIRMTEDCRPNMPRAAVEVDHKIPMLRRPDLRLDPRNLRASCRACNLAKEASDKSKYPIPLLAYLKSLITSSLRWRPWGGDMGISF